MNPGTKTLYGITIRPPRNYDLTKIAQRLEISRNELIYRAITDYLKRNQLDRAS
jgi:predicted transcriptional regulator